MPDPVPKSTMRETFSTLDHDANNKASVPIFIADLSSLIENCLNSKRRFSDFPTVKLLIDAIATFQIQENQLYDFPALR